MNITYPDVEVDYTGTDGNAFGIIGRVARAIRAEVGQDAATVFFDEATACGSYGELLDFVAHTVTVTISRKAAR